MKKMTWLLMLIPGITGELYAQKTSNKENMLEMPAEKITRRFFIDLGKSNKMQVDLEDIDDLRFINADSVLKVFLEDADAIKYKGDELSSKYINYAMDSGGINKISIKENKQQAAMYAIDQGNPALLKIEQDTINIIGKIASGNKRQRFYRISFFVNNLADLADYTGLQLKNKTDLVLKSRPSVWIKNTNGLTILPNDPSIYAGLAKGKMNGYDFLSLRLSVDVQNYKNYFVPSISFGLNISTNGDHVRREYGFFGEYHFLFSRNDKGKLETFANYFISGSYGQTPVHELDKSRISFPFYMSFGVLTKQKGDFYEKGTMRLGAGRVLLPGGKTSIEPSVYFNDFFRGLTPGLRIIQHF